MVSSMQHGIGPVCWFDILVIDCRNIIESARFDTGLRLLSAKWELGNRILQDYKRFGSYSGGKTQEDLSKELGLSQASLSDCIRFREKAGSDFNQFINALIKSNKIPSWRSIVCEWLPLRENHTMLETPSLPEGKFDVIYADPPWQYEFVPTQNRAIERHYPTMTLEEISSLNIPSSEDAILLLWAPAPKLEEALMVMKSWGFTYRTGMVWVKDKIGMGHWFRIQHEHLLLGRKGDFPTPDDSLLPSSVLYAERLSHSHKPELIYDLIEKLYPNHRYLELFATKNREGWASWGLEINVHA